MLLDDDNVAYGLWMPRSSEELLHESPLIIVGNLTSVDTIPIEHSAEITGNYNYIDDIGFGDYNSFTVLENDDDSKTYIISYNIYLKQYTVDIEEFLKAPPGFVKAINFPLENNITKVTQTASGISPHSSTALPDRLDLGSRALLYLDSWNEQKHYDSESFVLPNVCSGEEMLTKERMWRGGDFTSFISQNDVEYRNNFVSDKPIQFSYTKYMPTIAGEKFEIVSGNY